MNGKQLKNSILQWAIQGKLVYPHSFRHRYAKNFLEKFNDGISNGTSSSMHFTSPVASNFS